MYKSPIKIICGDIERQMDGEILRAVQNVGIIVEKDELLRALRYDRNQYASGYFAGKAAAVVHGEAIALDTEEWYCCPFKCLECGCIMMVRMPSSNFIYPYDDIAPVFCAKCGAKFDCTD